MSPYPNGTLVNFPKPKSSRNSNLTIILRLPDLKCWYCKNLSVLGRRHCAIAPGGIAAPVLKNQAIALGNIARLKQYISGKASSKETEFKGKRLCCQLNIIHCRLTHPCRRERQCRRCMTCPAKTRRILACPTNFTFGNRNS